MTVDPIQHHPDLVAIDRRLHGRLESVLAAEQEAAAVLARRSTTLRDRLLQAEDTGTAVRIWTTDQNVHHGLLATVAVDHVELHTPAGAVLVMMDALLAVELR